MTRAELAQKASKKLKVHYGKVVLDVVYILASGNHHKSHLNMPAQNHLGRRLSVFFLPSSAKIGSSISAFVATGSPSRKIRYSCVILLLYQRFE